MYVKDLGSVMILEKPAPATAAADPEGPVQAPGYANWAITRDLTLINNTSYDQ